MRWSRPGTLTRRRAVIAVLVTVLCIVSDASVLSAGAQERRIALVIGNAHYQHVPQLDNPTNDAKLIAATLGRLGFELVGGKAQLDLSRDGLQAAIRAFGEELGPNTVALFYYSGHGLQIDGTNYLVPVDANLERVADADFELLPADLVLKQMDRRGSGLNLVILDACRNSPFGGRGLKSVTAGLAEMSVPRGTLISYATQPGGVARDGPPGADSPFSRALADTLTLPGFDILRAFNRVGVLVGKATHQEQVPWVATSPIDGDYFLAGKVQNAEQSHAENAPQQEALKLPTPPIEPDVDELITKSKAAYEAKRFDEAMQWSRMAAARGSAAAMSDIGGLYQQGSGVPQDYAKAMRWYRQAADKGEPSAQNQVGWLYQQGLGVRQDYGEAMRWYRRAADGGSKEAENNIGYLYMRGWGIPRDPAEAMRWWKRSADKGHDVAMYNIGALYENGWGTAQNYVEAMYWYRRAADSGNRLAMNQIGWMFQAGAGVDKNYAEAMRWYRMASDHGAPIAMTNIGWLYQNGWGVQRDYAMALQWYQKAAAGGDADGMNDLGVMLAAGLGVPKDCAAAHEWFLKAATKGNRTAQQWLMPNATCQWSSAH